jgi:hypothetical protein
MADKVSKGMSEAGRDAPSFDWVTEDAYWRENYASRPYVAADLGYDHYRPAFRYGVESALLRGDRSWDDFEPELRRGWEQRSRSKWDDMKAAVRDAWDRVTGHHHRTDTGAASERFGRRIEGDT